ncbi:S-layer homology domain-containing protein [Falsibacillus albus]|uniref:S-layer homology domain-containing protein n=1 Tax=Falsibacillus albus TaxID=2478915 RepID=A0A3L7JWX5_9BACI|nr:S-layer homology domain-containing protein [Falsibacillus albus]
MQELPFSDVDNRANWVEAYIEKLASKGIVFGKTASNYAPSVSMTRGELAVIRNFLIIKITTAFLPGQQRILKKCFNLIS